MHRPPRQPRRNGPAPAAPHWRPALLPLVLAVALVLAGLAWLCWPLPGPAPQVRVLARASDAAPALPPGPGTSQPVPEPVGDTTVAPSPSATPGGRIWRQRDPDGDQTPDLADHVNEGERPTTAEAIERLRAAGVTGGLAAFQPPGTRPPLIGLAVPEDFVLPPGYVRHHQVTDDGQRIEAVLMYSPDQPPLDAQGQPLTVPADRVVPVDAAPPGLPLRRIRVPAPRDPQPERP